MITFEDAPDHVIAARTSGKITAEDIKAFVAELDARLARHDKIGVVTDITGLDGMTFDGLVQDMRAEFKYLGEWHRFPKVALIASDGFLKGMGETVGRLVPQVEVRTFPPTEREAAFAFAAEAGGEPPKIPT